MERREILIIDEDLSQSALIRDICDDAGYEVAVEASVEAALDRIQPNWPDLLILAMKQSEQNDFALIRSVREDDHLKDLPIIVIGARETRMGALTALASGADDYIMRPFGQLELVARVRAMLRRRYPSDSEERVDLYSIEDRPPEKRTPW